MTKATVCLATAFCALLAIECSSSSDNGTSKEGGGPPPNFADANGNPLAAPSPGICGNCAKPMACCVGFLSMTGQCQDPSMSCAGALAECMTPEDCMGGQVCCGKGGRGGAGFTFGCSASCTATGMGGFAFQLCDSMNPCPTGSMCVSPPGAPGGGGGGSMMMSQQICFNPAMFRMMMDGGSMTEAGSTTDAASEAGPAETGSSSDANSSTDTASPTDAHGG